MIQIIAGVYGRKMPNGTVKAMDKDSEPFNASPEQEERLIRLNLAVRVDPVDTDKPIGFDETPPDDDGDLDLPDGVVGIPEYSIESSAKELLEIAKLCGLTFKVGMSKTDMVAALDAHIEGHMVDGVEITGEDDAEDDGEPAPTFDASEAVL